MYIQVLHSCTGTNMYVHGSDMYVPFWQILSRWSGFQMWGVRTYAEYAEYEHVTILRIPNGFYVFFLRILRIICIFFLRIQRIFLRI
jgi:hypothetical protein